MEALNNRNLQNKQFCRVLYNLTIIQKNLKQLL